MSKFSVEALAKQFNKTPEEVLEVLRPMLRDLKAFCETDGSDAEIERFRQTEGGRAFVTALKRRETGGP